MSEYHGTFSRSSLRRTGHWHGLRYERRRPEKTPLHRIISENLESWLEWREAAERPVPGYVEEELRGYLQCGLLCFGFARARCTGCRTGFVVAFSCKGRGVCPSSSGRHMARDGRASCRSRHPAGARAAVDAAAAADMLAWENSGFSVDASVRITLLPPQVRV
jgi:hypothetical protein